MKRDLSPPEEFLRALEKYGTAIKGAAVKYGLENDGVDTEDIIQDVRTKLWEKFLASSEKNPPLSPSYINRVINTTLIDYLRLVRQRERLVEAGGCILPPAARNSNPVLRDEHLLRKTIRDACAALIDPRRQVVGLFLMGLSSEEIARTLGWSDGKTRNLLYRGLSDMRSELKKGGIDYENQ